MKYYGGKEKTEVRLRKIECKRQDETRNRLTEARSEGERKQAGIASSDTKGNTSDRVRIQWNTEKLGKPERNLDGKQALSLLSFLHFFFPILIVVSNFIPNSARQTFVSDKATNQNEFHPTINQLPEYPIGIILSEKRNGIVRIRERFVGGKTDGQIIPFEPRKN